MCEKDDLFPMFAGLIGPTNQYDVYKVFCVSNANPRYMILRYPQQPTQVVPFSRFYVTLQQKGNA
jgi:hypothetical protein